MRMVVFYLFLLVSGYFSDSVRYWLRNGDTFTQRMQIAETFIGESNYPSVGAEIQSISNDFDLTTKQQAEINTVLGFVQLWKDESSANYFKLEEFVIDNLTSLVQFAEDKSLINGLRVNSLLYAVRGDLIYEPEVVFPTNTTNLNYQQIDNTDAPVKTMGIDLKVSPNPTSGQTEISYDIPQNISCTILQVVDFSGKILIEQKIGARQGHIAFDSSNYPRGILVCHLFCDDEIIFSKKIISVK